MLLHQHLVSCRLRDSAATVGRRSQIGNPKLRARPRPVKSTTTLVTIEAIASSRKVPSDLERRGSRQSAVGRRLVDRH